MKKILVVGGTGMMGTALVKQLLQNGDQVRVMSRNPEKHAVLTNAGAEVVPGDLIDKDSLAKACEGMDVVISAAHAMLGKGRYTSGRVDGEGQIALIDAARAAGIQHFIFTSVIGVTPDHPIDFSRSKWQAENHLKQSGLAYNIIRASAFMELHIGELLGKSILKKGSVTIFGQGVNRANFVSVKDVARLIVLCAHNPQHQNQTFDIGGPDNLSRHEIVALYAEKLGKPVKISHLSNGMLRFLSKVIKPFHPGISRIMLVSDVFDRQDQSFDVGPLLKIFPMELTSVSEYIRSQ